MKRFHIKALAASLLAAAAWPGPLGQERIHHHVEVVYQEILVRVFDGERPVPGLQAADFTLYEQGRRVPIAHCREVRRSLANPASEPRIAPHGAAQPKPRLFLFMLWLDEESREWPRAWEYFLRHVHRPGDRVILSDGERMIEVLSPEQEAARLQAFFAGLSERLKRRQLEKARLVNELEKAAADFHDNLVFNPALAGSGYGGQSMEQAYLREFMIRTQGAIDEYRLGRLKGQPFWLQRLAGALKAVEAEKWVLVFLQNEKLPLLHRDGRLFREAPMRQETITELTRFKEQLERQVQMGSDVIGYLRDLRPLFIGANATFHVFLSDAAGEALSSEHLLWQPVFSSWEGTFRQISSDSGGIVANTTQLGEALRQAAEREDVHYVLTFKPAEGPARERHIRVGTRRPGWTVVHARKLTLGELFPLSIRALEWRDGRLTVALADFQRSYGEDGFAGRLRVAVRAEPRKGKALAAEKEIAPAEPAVDVEMALHFPVAGRDRVSVEVSALLTGTRARAEKEIDVPPPPARPGP